MLNQATGYAATALGLVAAANGQPVLVKEIAEVAGIPSPYLAKIVNALARKSVLVTQRGIGGGVTLAKPPEEISLMDLCVALDDPSIQDRCMLGAAECSDQRACPAHEFWTAVRTRYIDFLRRTTIADVAAFELRRRASTPSRSGSAPTGSSPDSAPNSANRSAGGEHVSLRAILPPLPRKVEQRPGADSNRRPAI